MTKTIIRVAAAMCVAAVVCACGSKGLITKGNSSKMDTISYALGSNIGYGVKGEFRDIPFDTKTIAEGIGEAMLEKSSKTQEEAIGELREYFMSKRPVRSREVAEKRRLADSIRLAEGDSTVVEYPAADPDMFESEQERTDLSYLFGVDIGTNVRNTNVPLQVYWLKKGFIDAQEENCSMTPADVNSILQNYFMVVRPQELAEASAAWLEKVEKKWGVKKTESGLLYKVVRKGDEVLKAESDRDVVVVRYRGTTRDGREFDSSYKREDELKKMIADVRRDKSLTEEERESRLERLQAQMESAASVEFPLNRVIKGWTEGMKLVGKGGKITLWIPSDLAYGPRGTGRDIGPNEALRFDVEIVDVKPFVKPEPKPVAPVEEEE